MNNHFMSLKTFKKLRILNNGHLELKAVFVNRHKLPVFQEKINRIEK